MKKTNPEPEPDNFFRKYKAIQGLVNDTYLELKKEIERKELHAYIQTNGKLDYILLEKSESITAMDVATLGKYMLIQDIYKGTKTGAPGSDLKIPDELERTVHTMMGPVTVNVLTGVVTKSDGEILPKDISEEIVRQMIQEMENE